MEEYEEKKLDYYIDRLVEEQEKANEESDIQLMRLLGSIRCDYCLIGEDYEKNRKN